MRNPKVRFRLNKSLDKKMGTAFLSHSKAGVSFGDKILRDHPRLKTARETTNSKKRKGLVDPYVDLFYRKQQKRLEQTKEKFQKQWDKTAEAFFEASGKLFNNHPWPNGEYIGYVSIFDCNPRFLENKTFQVFWKHPRGGVSVSAHEMLHFIFYDFIGKYISKGKISKESLWQLSEVFNTFALAEPAFVKVTKDRKPTPYRDLAFLASQLYPLWKETRKAQPFLSSCSNNLSDYFRERG